MGDCGIGNFRHQDDIQCLGACPALFPCNNALPARNRLGVAQDTCLQESRPLARARIKELSLSGQSVATAAAEEIPSTFSGVSQLRRPTERRTRLLFEEVCSSSRNTITC